MPETSSDLARLRIFSGTAHRALGEAIAHQLGLPLGQVAIRRFSDGEIGVQFLENIRGQDVFIVQPTHAPTDNLMELLIMMDAAKRASARRITVVFRITAMPGRTGKMPRVWRSRRVWWLICFRRRVRSAF